MCFFMRRSPLQRIIVDAWHSLLYGCPIGTGDCVPESPWSAEEIREWSHPFGFAHLRAEGIVQLLD